MLIENAYSYDTVQPVMFDGRLSFVLRFLVFSEENADGCGFGF